MSNNGDKRVDSEQPSVPDQSTLSGHGGSLWFRGLGALLRGFGNFLLLVAAVMTAIVALRVSDSTGFTRWVVSCFVEEQQFGDTSRYTSPNSVASMPTDDSTIGEVFGSPESPMVETLLNHEVSKEFFTQAFEDEAFREFLLLRDIAEPRDLLEKALEHKGLPADASMGEWLASMDLNETRTLRSFRNKIDEELRDMFLPPQSADAESAFAAENLEMLIPGSKTVSESGPRQQYRKLGGLSFGINYGSLRLRVHTALDVKKNEPVSMD